MKKDKKNINTDAKKTNTKISFFDTKHKEAFAVTLIILGFLISFSLFSFKESGGFGSYVKILYSFTFGHFVSYIIPAILGLWGLFIFKKVSPKKIFRYILLALIAGITASTSLGLYKYTENQILRSGEWEFAGLIGNKFSAFLFSFFGSTGSYVFLSGFLLIFFSYAFDFRISQMVKFLFSPLKLIYVIYKKIYAKIKKGKLKKKFEKEIFNDVDNSNNTFFRNKTNKTNKTEEYKPNKTIKIEESDKENIDLEPEISETNNIDHSKQINDDIDNLESQIAPSIKENEQKAPQPKVIKQKNKTDVLIEKQIIEDEVEFKANKIKKYMPPSIDLLNEPRIINHEENEESLRQNAVLLEDKLHEFNLDAKVVQINPGPVITQYEIKLAKGVKVAKVNSLEKDLAMALRAKSIRIVAPIPGKDTVGIEIPNANPSIVYLRTIINSDKFVNHKSKLAIALGKTISGENYILDLKKTPHLLIAGATGSGKSVCINGIIMSIIFRTTPDEVRFCMIDPKKVELSVYSNLVKHHLLQIDGLDEAVVTKPDDAVRLLEALVIEMENRYETLMHSGTRNIDEYNDLIDSGELTIDHETMKNFEKMPYIITIVDEYGDLMMTSGKKVETPICRLAQMSRAIGIHLVLATQRPSVKVVTGIIKSNFPTRIAFRVMSLFDSRTILDMKGAESLLGKGDMLLIPPGESEVVRIQNALVETKEINKVVKHISTQRTDFSTVKIKVKSTEEAVFDGIDDDFSPTIKSKQKDLLYEEARRMVIQGQMASVSMLQRGLSIGYARAGKIIDQLERNGVIGPHVGSKSRSVLEGQLSD